MINTGYSSHQLLSLFGRQNVRKPGADAPANNIAELAKKAEEAIAAERKARASSATSTVVESRPSLTWEENERRAEEARAVIAQQQRVEDAFEVENGFRRKATPGLAAWYNQSISNGVNAWSLGSHEEAADFATQIVSSVWTRSLDANRAKATLADATEFAAVAKWKGLSEAQTTAMLEDERSAARMTAVIETLVFNKTFEVTGGSILGRQDGCDFLNNVEVRYQGKILLTVEGNGEKVTRYDETGNAIQTDMLHRVALNRPGAFAPLTPTT